MSTILERPHAKAIIERLETTTIAGTPLKVGDAIAPKKPNTSPEQILAPAAILYGRQGGTFDNGLGCQDQDGTLQFQVTYVGRSAAEALTVADEGTTALTSTPMAVTGRKLQRARRLSPSAQTMRDTDVTPPMFYVPVMYRLRTFDAS